MMGYFLWHQSSYAAQQHNGDDGKTQIEVNLVLSNGRSLNNILLDMGMVVPKNDMEDLYQRAADISHALKVTAWLLVETCVLQNLKLRMVSLQHSLPLDKCLKMSNCHKECDSTYHSQKLWLQEIRSTEQ